MRHTVRGALLKRNRNEEILQLSLRQRLLEGLLIVSGAMALFLLLALWTYHPGIHSKISMNIAGHLGDRLAHFFFNSFGSLAYLFPALLLYSGWQGFKKVVSLVYRLITLFLV